MLLIESPVPVSLMSETKAIIIVVAPSAMVRTSCAVSGLAHAAHNEGAPRCQTTIATFLQNAPVSYPTSLTSEIGSVLLGVAPWRSFVVQRLVWTTLPTVKERHAVRQQWQQCR